MRKELIKIAAAKIVQKEMNKEAVHWAIPLIAGVALRGLFAPQQPQTDPWAALQNAMMFKTMMPMLREMDLSTDPEAWNIS